MQQEIFYNQRNCLYWYIQAKGHVSPCTESRYCLV